MTDRPLRSVLYVPADKPKALAKIPTLPCDGVILDLEDAVAPGAKEAAREALARTLPELDLGRRTVLIRVNGAGTPWHEADLAAASALPCDGILLPKVGSGEEVPPGRFWAMIETPEGVLGAPAIAARCDGLVMGTNDLAKELGTQGRGALTTALQSTVLAARRSRTPVLDGVYNAFRDEAGLREECVQGRDWGFDGKTLIHPSQIEPANEIFAPSEEALELARRQIEAFEAAGGGVAVLDGRIVENLHVETARRLLAQARAIAEMEG